MKKFIAILLAGVLVFAFAACTNTNDNNATDGNASAGDTKELTPITVCLDWTPNTNHTGLYVADALGYYEEAGLKVSIVQPPEDGAELMTASGQAQFGVSFQDTIAAAYDQSEPLPVTAVAAMLQHNTSGIITRKGEGAHTPAGLAGMRYSTWNSPIEIKMMQHIMEKDGASFDELEILPNTVTNEAQALLNKDTDAIWIFYAWAGVACELSELEFDYFDFKDIDPVFDYYTPILVANNDFLKNSPDVAKAFLAATAKGYEYAANNPKEAAQILIDGDTTGSLNGSEALVNASQEWIAKEYISDAPYWGHIDENRWNAFYTWLYENELTQNDLSGFGFDNSFLG